MTGRTKAPEWLAKYSSNAYVVSALRTLGTREIEREHARQASPHATPETGQASRNRLKALDRIAEKIRSLHSAPAPQEGPHLHYSVSVGLHPSNQLRNRYGDIQPYDRTRVVPATNQADTTEAQGKYLNASWVLERYGQKWWIASQAPLPNTAHTFLSLFLQPTTSPPLSLSPVTNSSYARSSRIRTVVQLTNNIEGGRTKAHAYFPNEIGHSVIVYPEDGDRAPALKVTLTNRQTIQDAHCIQSTISLIPVVLKKRGKIPGSDHHIKAINGDTDEYSILDGQEPITFQHMLYTSWPDHGVPRDSDRASLLSFIRLVDSKNRHTSLATNADDTDVDADPPIIVGCSAGIGRTGSFIALSSLLRNFGFLPKANSPCLASALPPSPLGALPHAQREDLVVQEIDSLREQRPGMVQRNEQVLLVYEILASAFVL